MSQTVPIGNSATFTVAASGTGPLSYQWSENGVVIPGATGASYTTSAVALGSGGSTSIGSFQVVVSNSSSSATSTTAKLTAGPRSPKPGDLRYLLFEQVDTPGLAPTAAFRADNTEVSYPNAVGSPVTMGSCSLTNGCAWGIAVSNLPAPLTGLTAWYGLGYNHLGNGNPSFAAQMQGIVASNVVVNSLDIEVPEDAFAASWVQTAQAGGFDYKLEAVPLAQVPSTVAADGAASRVVTAVSFDDSTGLANLISYGWQGDTTTVYDTQEVTVPPANIIPTVTNLANQGYIISAFGGNDIDGYMVVGMRVTGDTLPRSIAVNDTPATNPTSAYFTTVVYLFETNGYTIITQQ